MSGELVLWAGSVLPLSFEQRVEAAVAGGFTATSLFPIEVRRRREAGRDDRELSELLARAGLAVTVIDPLAKWLPDWNPPAALPDSDPAAGAFEPTEVVDMAVTFGAPLVSAIGVFSSPVEVRIGSRCFARVCDEAAERGVRVQLEAIPGSAVPDLASAWEIVRRADRDNGGLVLDAWHFFRAGPDWELLAALPPARIFAVQLDDAPREPHPDTAHESLHLRLLPGEGELDVARFLRTLLATGARPPIGPEVFSDELYRQPPAEIGRRLGDSTRALLAAARS